MVGWRSGSAVGLPSSARGRGPGLRGAPAAHRPRSRALLGALFVAASACGGNVGHSAPTEESCAFIPDSRKDDDPCLLYCEAYRSCASCEPVVISACRNACEETVARDDNRRTCLGCAVEHLEAVEAELTCDAAFDANAAAPTFTLKFDPAACGAKCPGL